MAHLIGDLRYAWRAFIRTPAFTAAALLTLTLGILTSTAIFSLVHAVLLQPLPYPHPERLVMLLTDDVRPNAEHYGNSTYRDFEHWRMHSQSFEEMTIYYQPGWGVMTLTGIAEPQKVQGAFVDGRFFRVMQVAPALGRAITPEDVARSARVVVLSDGLWQRRFGGSRDALGADFEIEGARWRVIGVMPPHYEAPYPRVQFWAPITAHPDWIDREESDPLGRKRWFVTARLEPDVSLRAAQAEMRLIASQLAQADPAGHKTLDVRVVALHDRVTGGARSALWLLLGAVLFVLLIACANVANLVLARGASRVREITIRAALGASRVRLIRQLVTESLALAGMAGLLALALAEPMIRAVKLVAPAGIPRLDAAGLSAPVLFFAVSLSIVSAVLFGVAPAIGLSRSDVSGVLNDGGRAMSLGRRGRRLHGALLAAECAIAIVLAAGAALLIRSFIAVVTTDQGFRPDHVLTLGQTYPKALSPARQVQRDQEALERVRALPGVQAVGRASNLFYLNETRTHALRLIEGRAPEPTSQWTPLVWTQVSGDYFQALGVPLRKGRYFAAADGPNAPPVAIVNETLARRYWPNEDPIGKRLKGFDPRGQHDDWLTVVGVVGDARNAGVEKRPIAQIYEVQVQRDEQTPNLVVRTTGDPHAIAAAVRAAVRAIDPSAILSDAMTLDDLLSEQTARRRFQTWLVTIFSALALLLVATGIYGVTHYAVAQRTQEIGIRVALGAQRAAVLRLVLREVMTWSALGMCAGLLGALWLADMLSSLLYGIGSADPLAFTGASVLLLAIAGAAGAIPARRAARIDPLVALRRV